MRDASARFDAGGDGPSVHDGNVGLDAVTARCDGNACFCDNLPSCTPAQDFSALPLGSMGRRICGITIQGGGQFCEFTAFREVEGGVTASRCQVALGATCTSPTLCRELFSCNLLMQSCPVDLLDCSRPEPCAPRDPGIEACCSGYAVSSLTGQCVCICSDTLDEPFDTLASCQSACGAPDGAADSGKTGTADASACAALETDIVAEWSKLAECTQTGDCTTAYNNLCSSSGPIIGNVGCFLPIARSADVSVLKNLEQRYLRECNGQPGTCDCNALPPSECVAGHCRTAL
jgi:hypothetical protein